VIVDELEKKSCDLKFLRRRNLQVEKSDHKQNHCWSIHFPENLVTSMMAPTKIKERGQKTLPTDVLEKDEVELRLEKALFGDDAGFLESLTREQPPEAEQLSRREDTDFEGFGSEDDQEELDDVADEDVGTTGIEAPESI
jgi:hypothetical protein